MAIPTLAPSVSRSKQIVVKGRSRVALQLVPNFPNFSSGQTADKKVFVIFLSVIAGFGLLSLLAINTFLAQDAFELRKLQAQVQTLSDQRDAVLKQISKASSPEVLSAKAIKVGMVESQSPRFLSVPPDSHLSLAK